MTLENFDTSLVVSVEGLFLSCTELKRLDLGDKFNTSKVKDMRSMFSNCKKLEYLNLGNNFTTNKVTDMSFMFNGCSSLKNLIFKENFNIILVSTMRGMFHECKKLNNICTSENFTSHSLENASSMFCGCENLRSLNLGSKFYLEDVNCCMMFQGCEHISRREIIELVGDKFRDVGVDRSQQFIIEIISGQRVLVKYLERQGVTRAVIPSDIDSIGEEVFKDCRLVEEVECSAPLPKSVKNMFKGFLGTKLKLVNFDTHNVTNMSGMFLNCKNLTKLDLGDSFDTSNVISVEHMFEGCENLERLYLGDLFNTRNVKYFGSMFSSCLLLRALSLGKQFSMVNVEDTTFMFNSTASLEFLRLPRGDVYLKLCSSINTNYLPELRIHYL